MAYRFAGSKRPCMIWPLLVSGALSLTVLGHSHHIPPTLSFNCSRIQSCSKYLLTRYCLPDSFLLQDLHTRFNLCQSIPFFPWLPFYSSFTPFQGEFVCDPHLLQSMLPWNVSVYVYFSEDHSCLQLNTVLTLSSPART